METLDDVVDLVARRYAARCWWADLDDLKQEAWAAVLKAETTFDPQHGTHFHGYAWRAALYSLRDFTRRMGSPVYAPDKKLAELEGLQRAEVDLTIPANQEAADELLHAGRQSERVLALLRAELGRGLHGEAVMRILLGGETPRAVAGATGVDVRLLWAAVGNAKVRLRKDPELKRLMRLV